MAKVGRLSVVVTAGTSGLTRGLRAGERAVDSFAGRANKAGAAIGGQMRKGLNSGVPALAKLTAGATAAATAIGYLTMKSIDAVGDANDFAKSVGVSYTEMRKLQKAAGLSGVDLSTMNVALMKMSDVLGSAFGGNEAAIESFTNIGVSVESLRRLRPEQQLLAIGEAINRIKDPSEKIEATRNIFGRSGGDLISFFSNAKGDMENAGKALDSFGISLSQLDVEKIDAAGDAMGEFKFITEGVGNQLAKHFAPLITDVSERLLGMIDEAGGVGSAMDHAFASGVSGMGRMLDAVESLSIAWLKLVRTVTAVGIILSDVHKGASYISPGGVLGKLIDWSEGDATDKRLQGIAPDKRDAARAELEKQGGFQSEKPDYRAELLAENEDFQRQIKEAEDNRTKRGTLGDRFKAWEKSAQAKGATNAAAALANASVTRLEAEEAITDEAEKQTKEKKEQLRLEQGGQGKFALMAFNGVTGTSAAKADAVAEKAGRVVTAESKKKGVVAQAMTESPVIGVARQALSEATKELSGIAGGAVATHSTESNLSGDIPTSAQKSVYREEIARRAAEPPSESAWARVAKENLLDREANKGAWGRVSEEYGLERGRPKYEDRMPSGDPIYESRRPAGGNDWESKIPTGEPAYKAKMGDSMTAAVSANPMATAQAKPADMTKVEQLLESIDRGIKGGMVGRLA